MRSFAMTVAIGALAILLVWSMAPQEAVSQ